MYGHIHCLYTVLAILCRNITEYTVTYLVYIQFWPIPCRKIAKYTVTYSV